MRRSMRIVVLPVPAPASMRTFRVRSAMARSRSAWSGTGPRALAATSVVLFWCGQFEGPEAGESAGAFSQQSLGAVVHTLPAHGLEGAVFAVLLHGCTRERALAQKPGRRRKPLTCRGLEHLAEVAPVILFLGTPAHVGVRHPDP